MGQYREKSTTHLHSQSSQTSFGKSSPPNLCNHVPCQMLARAAHLQQPSRAVGTTARIPGRRTGPTPRPAGAGRRQGAVLQHGGCGPGQPVREALRRSPAGTHLNGHYQCLSAILPHCGFGFRQLAIIAPLLMATNWGTLSLWGRLFSVPLSMADCMAGMTSCSQFGTPSSDRPQMHCLSTTGVNSISKLANPKGICQQKMCSSTKQILYRFCAC